MKKKIVPITLSLILILGSLLPSYAASVGELNNEKADVQGKITEAQGQQEEVKEQLSAEMQEVVNLNNSIDEVERQIQQLQSEIDTLQASIDQKQQELEQKQEEHDKNQKLLEDRLVVMYEAGETSFLDMLFSSKNIVEFISNYYLWQQLIQCDRELLDTIEKEQEEITNTKQQLEQEKTKVDSAKVEQETKNNLLKSQKAERQRKVDALSAEEKALQSEIEEYNKKLKEIDNAIEQAMAEALKAEQQGGSGSNFDGTFIWPLDYSPRRVTSRMKFRWGRWHKGIDIGTNAETGKRVIAAASGTVIYSAYQSGSSSAAGYGNYLIIYHGNGYCTLYAHLNSKLVSTGQRVSQGQLIAYSGNTGGVAPHLHFEIRKASSVGNFFGNNWLDPLDYMPGGYVIVD